MARIFNFNAGPATLPEEVLAEAASEMLDFQGTGMSLIESSHRGKAYDAVHAEAVANYRKLLNCPDDYAVLFLPGGASMQFAMLPLNLLATGRTADYINSGALGREGHHEAQRARPGQRGRRYRQGAPGLYAGGGRIEIRRPARLTRT